MADGMLIAGDGATSDGRIEPVHADSFTQMMEQLQEGYVASVAATAGCAFELMKHQTFNFDGLLVRPGRTASHQEVSTFVQLKSTTTIKPDPASPHFSFQLKKREYFDRLAAPRTDPKAILIVMATSPRQIEWSDASHDQLTVSHCCYWVSLEGQAIAGETKKPTIHVPTSNIFDATALTAIMDKIDRGESLNGA